MAIKSLGLKVSLIVALIITAIVLIIFFIVQAQSLALIYDLTASEARSSNSTFEKEIEILQADAVTTAKIISYSYEVIESILREDDAALKSALIRYGEEVDTVMVVDVEGNVLMRKHNDTKGDNVYSQSIVSSTLRTGVGIGTIAKGSTVGMATRGSAVIRDYEGKIIGAVVCGHDLTNAKYVDAIGDLTGSEVTIFDGDTRLMTTIRDNRGERVVGSQATAEVVEAVLKRGEVYTLQINLYGNEYYACYSPLVIDGDVIGMLFSGVNIAEALRGQQSMVDTVLLVGIAFGVVGILVVFIFNLFSVSKRLKKIGAFAEKIRNGDLGISAASDATVQIRSSDEVGALARALEHAYSQLRGYVGEIKERMQGLADGDLATESTFDFQGDFVLIKDSINDIVRNLNQTMTEINGSSTQVSAGSKQVAHGAQALAQGSTEQAASIQELSSSIAEIASKTRQNADTAEKTSKLSAAIKDNAEKGSRQMDEMITAVDEINEASRRISKIIKTIDDIAFQTNILALNAAVEAARAGQHGKGFAVVAEEVRNLASKSAEAAKNTGDMIQNSMDKADFGSRIAGETAASLKDIVTGINESTLLVNEIARASEEQSLGIAQINTGIDQVAQVVQQNSATAEESAAASEEMSGQSDMLQRLISQFNLSGSGAPLSSLPSADRSRQRKPAVQTEHISDYTSGYGAGGFGKY